MDVDDFEVVAGADEAILLERSKHALVLAAGTAENTRKAYRSAVQHFQRWGGMLPANEHQIVQYLMAHSESLSSRTLALRLTALSQWHIQQGFADPTQTATVRKTLIGISRLFGKPKRKAKALAIEDLLRVVDQLRADVTLVALRDSALLQLGYFGAFRRSELVALRVEDVEWVTDGMIVRVPRSKTDQTGEGISKGIPYGDGSCCAVLALRTWLDAAKISAGWMFRPISRWGVMKDAALDAGSVNTILRKVAMAAGVEYALSLASHSMRRGMATSSYRAGASFESIKRQGAWVHDGTVQGYIEEANLFQENAADSLLKKRRS